MGDLEQTGGGHRLGLSGALVSDLPQRFLGVLAFVDEAARVAAADLKRADLLVALPHDAQVVVPASPTVRPIRRPRGPRGAARRPLRRSAALRRDADLRLDGGEGVAGGGGGGGAGRAGGGAGGGGGGGPGPGPLVAAVGGLVAIDGDLLGHHEPAFVHQLTLVAAAILVRAVPLVPLHRHRMAVGAALSTRVGSPGDGIEAVAVEKMEQKCSEAPTANHDVCKEVREKQWSKRQS